MKKEKLTQQEELELAIEKGKKDFGKVYKTIIADENIIWRKLRRSEYKEVMNIFVMKEVHKLDDNGELLVDEEGNYIMGEVIDDDATYDARQEAIANFVILYPTNNNIVEDMAAVAEIIATECMIKSGFGEAPVTTEC